jgi:teichoic acid transport system ATP-binding protein
MYNEQEEVKGASNKNVIHAENVGVYFDRGTNQDDYKSRLLNVFKRKENKKNQPQKFWSLQDIHFAGHKGEILGIIGSNGAGKTTLSKVITGILRNDKGTMDVDGKVTALFSFGMGFNRELTGRENVYLNGMMLGIDKQLINEYIDDIHAFSDLEKFMDQPMKYYSSGMKARLGFSVAAHLQPEVLILDEALNTGDTRFSNKAAEKMRDLVQKAKMVIIVTHSLNYAQKNCDRLLWLHKGKVKEIGDPKTIVANYRATVPPPVKKKQSLKLTKTETDISTNPVIKATNLGVSFKLSSGEFWALRDLNFTIHEGEVVGIIGHNGAGKSTLCKVMTRILAPDEGMVQVYGETSSLLGYGTGFNPQLTGTDNIYLNAMLLGIPKSVIDEKYEEIVEFSGIKKRIDKPVKHYSSGMRARLGFSIAAVLKPDVFIIDEALSTGDLAFRQKATERIQEMMDRAKAVVIVSHSMPFVEKVCTRAIWIDKGRVRLDGDAEEVVAEYQKVMGATKKRKLRKRPVKQKKNTQAKQTTTVDVPSTGKTGSEVTSEKKVSTVKTESNTSGANEMASATMAAKNSPNRKPPVAKVYQADVPQELDGAPEEGHMEIPSDLTPIRKTRKQIKREREHAKIHEKRLARRKRALAKRRFKS